MIAAPYAFAGRLAPALGDGTQLVQPAWTPLGVSKQEVNVVVQLSGDPVAVQQANAGRKLSKSEKDQIKAQLKGPQNALRNSIASMGGKVLADYQSSYNGIKVRIARDKAQNLATLPGVIAVRPLQVVHPDNIHGVPLIGTPGVWQSLGLRGEGVKIAIIDTGIDYTHANFGGPGTAGAYTTAHAAETTAANPLYFGPGAPRVKGGIDLVGDSYNADPASAAYQPIPHPDPNPLDCNGHGSHVAGTAAGSGVTSAGATYTGPYDTTTSVVPTAWNVWPGVAPKADLYAVRVFGCDGSTDVVVDAIEWAVDNNMDVINMSLGSSFGTKDTPDAEAANNAAKAGIVVVTSAGNSGHAPYIVGSPSTADGAISVAAIDPSQNFPAASLALSTGQTVVAIDANGATFANGTSYPVAVLRNSYPSGSIALGCSQAEYNAYPGGAAALAGKMIVTVRGTCSRVARAIFAQQNGAAAALMINTSTIYPPYEGPITGSAETGPYNVTIPFFGVRGVYTTSGTDGNKVLAAAGGTATATNTLLANPNFAGLADFTSGGARTGDSFLKPELSAPGVSISSTAVGSGNKAEILSGTSMAAPHVAGVAALTVQAHPTWKPEDLKAAIVNTAIPSGVTGYDTRLAGAGLVQPAGSTKSKVVAHGDGGGKFSTALNFGFEEIKEDYSKKKHIHVDNNGSTPVSFNVARTQFSGSPHTVALNKTSVTIPANGHADVEVTLNVPVATVGASDDYREVAGIITLSPASASDNNNVALRLPYYFVPRALSDVSTKLGDFKGTDPTATATVTNKKAGISGDADFYAWGLEGKKDPGRNSNDIRAVGVQSFPDPSTSNPDRRLLVFAVNTFDRWSNAATSEFDIGVDVDGDGIDDYIIVGIDSGALTTGTFNGIMGTYVFSTRSSGASASAYGTTAPTDSSTALLPVRSSQFCRAGEPCLSKTLQPRITYNATGYDLVNGGVDVVPGSAKFNVWDSAISTGDFVSVAPGATDSSVVISVKSSEWAVTPAKGLMIVTLDNKSGGDEAQLLDVKPKK